MKWLKIGGVIFGAVIITALGIDAADTLSGSRSTLLGQLATTDKNSCEEGMIAVPSATTFTCVDEYESSASPECPLDKFTSEFNTHTNLETESCKASSKDGQTPWVYITREEAQVACLRAGKRLPTNEEWQVLAAGTPDTDAECNTSRNSPSVTGGHSLCQSAIGAFDAVGNVWEWTSDDVFDGQYNGRALPQEGFVAQVDNGGVAAVSTTSPQAQFGADYFWMKPEGAFGIMRGGYHGSKEDAGVFAVHAATRPTFVSAAIGFRCLK